jgi:hypothetical protein
MKRLTEFFKKYWYPLAWVTVGIYLAIKFVRGPRDFYEGFAGVLWWAGIGLGLGVISILIKRKR